MTGTPITEQAAFHHHMDRIRILHTLAHELSRTSGFTLAGSAITFVLAMLAEQPDGILVAGALMAAAIICNICHVHANRAIHRHLVAARKLCCR